MSPRPAGSGWPGPRRPLVNVRLEPEQVALIDKLAGVRGVTRSAWLRGAIDAALSDPDSVTPR